MMERNGARHALAVAGGRSAGAGAPRSSEPGGRGASGPAHAPRRLDESETLRPDNATLRRLYLEEGRTISALADHFDVPPQTVHRWLVAAAVPRRGSALRPRVDVGDEEIRRLYVEEHLSAPEIAYGLNCSLSTVYFRLARLGVARRSCGARRRPAAADLREGYVDRGLTVSELADQYGVSRQTVGSWLIDAGIPRRPPTALPAAAKEMIVTLYQAGRSGPEIADELGCSTATVYRRLKDACVPRRTRHSQVARDDLVRALHRGLSAPAIAAELEVSVSCVCGALRREGLHTRRQAARQRLASRRAKLVALSGPTVGELQDSA
ncbi:MAG: helix-turn-helix domain-containing protein [Acidimicrobiales bacterium]